MTALPALFFLRATMLHDLGVFADLAFHRSERRAHATCRPSATAAGKWKASLLACLLCVESAAGCLDASVGDGGCVAG
jgi:hypothetical protein